MNSVRLITVEDLQNDTAKAITALSDLCWWAFHQLSFFRYQAACVMLGLEKFSHLLGDLFYSYRMNRRLWFLCPVLSFGLRDYSCLFKVSQEISKTTPKKEKKYWSQVKLTKIKGVFVGGKRLETGYCPSVLLQCQLLSEAFPGQPIKNCKALVQLPLLLYFSPWHLPPDVLRILIILFSLSVSLSHEQLEYKHKDRGF